MLEFQISWRGKKGARDRWMVTAPRAFLMTRPKTNEWTITVHRDLEDLLAAWRRWSCPDETVAVLHLGIDRPHESEFEEIVARFPGKVLLTAAAKSALPSGFQASREPVGDVADLPIHLGTHGWGYRVDDDLAEVACGAEGRMSSHSLEGWVREFVDENPYCLEALSQAKIFNEADYLANEVSLPSFARQKTGAYRSSRLNINLREDPCAIALASPPWLSARAIETIGLNPRVTSLFVNQGITTVGDLGKWSMPRLLQLPNCRRTVVRDLCKCLEFALEGPVDLESRRNNEEEHSNLLASIRRSLSTFRDRDRDIVSRRMGLLGQSDILKQIADDYGVTTERVRQIELRAIQRLVREGVWCDILNNKLEAQLHSRETPLPIKDIEAADSWFEGVSEFPDILRYILDNMSDGAVGVVTIDGVSYLAQMNQCRWEETLTEARRLLESRAGKGCLESDCRSIVVSLLPRKAFEFSLLLWKNASALAHFTSEVDGLNVLLSYGRSVDRIVEAVLTESDEPLHYSAISARATERAGRSIDVRTAHRAAASVGHWLGKGTYGAARHIPQPEILQKISAEAEDIVACGSAGRQWHASEILSAMVERDSFELSEEVINKYIVEIALREWSGLRRLGRMTWTAGDAQDDVSRIDLRRAMISLLQEAGRPLQTHEIRQRLVALRGINEHFHIATMDPVLRVGVGLWGLNDRDIAIKRPNQPQLLDELIAMLEDREIGIHVSELGRWSLTLDSALSVQTLFSLAHGDNRLKISPAQNLYLAEWGGSRRESMREAAIAVLTSSTQPLVLADIRLQVEKRIRRMCDRRSLIRCLRALEADADPSTETWSFNLKPPPADEDPVLVARQDLADGGDR